MVTRYEAFGHPRTVSGVSIFGTTGIFLKKQVQPLFQGWFSHAYHLTHRQAVSRF